MVLIGILLLLSGGAVWAAPPPEPRGDPAGISRSGFWVDAGLGLTSVGFGGDAGARGVEREGGLTLRGAAGYAPSPRLRLGAEVSVWAKETSGVTAVVRTVSGVAYFFPSADRRLWLKGGLGALVLDESDIGNRGSGLAWTAAIGRDFGLGRRSFLTPYLQATGSTGVEIVQNGRNTGFTENPSLVQLGVAFGWQ